MTVHPRPFPRPSVLVLDGNERASLAVVRSLVRAGFPVHVATDRRWSIAGVARGVTSHRLTRVPLVSPEAYAREVAGLAGRLGVSIVVPVTDASAEAVLAERARFPSGVVFPFASHAVYRAASDKALVHNLALDAGIGIEETTVVDHHGDPAPSDPRLYPGFVKPHRSVVGGSVRTKLGVRSVANQEECTRVLGALPAEAFPVLVQRRVEGPGEGVFLARWGGRTIARFAHRRLREKPPGGGVSVYREAVEMDPAVLAACERLLDGLDWKGVAMIEGKRDVERGGWRVMEINGRFWGSLQLAVDAGVDFPSLLIRAVLGEDTGPSPAYRRGVRLRWEWGDVDHLLIRMRRSRRECGLGPEAPGRLGAFLRFFAFRPKKDRTEVFRWTDPMPFVVETLDRLGIVR